MPSEKAKENKTLTAICNGCGKSLSAELVQGVLIRQGHRRLTVPVCDSCRSKGWTPPPTVEASLG